MHTIETIRSVIFNPHPQSSKPDIFLELPPAIEPNETPSNNKQSNNTLLPAEPRESVKSEKQYEPISEHTLQILDSLTQNPDKFENPFELAEILFISGNVKKASIFYKEALNRKDPNDIGTSEKKAWILFQIGNCLRNDELQEAKNNYKQLITEYPGYPWADIAKVQEKLIEWYLIEKPHKLIEECKKLANEI